MNAETIPTAAHALRRIYEAHGFCDEFTYELHRLHTTLQTDVSTLYQAMGDDGLGAVFRTKFPDFLRSLMATDSLYSIQEETPGAVPAMVFWVYQHVLTAVKQSDNTMLMDKLLCDSDAKEPWETVWTNRKRIISYGNPVALGSLHLCLTQLTKVYDRCGKLSVAARTAIPQLAVYAWMHTRDEHNGLYCHFALSMASTYFVSDFRENKTVAVNAVLDEYGPENVLKRFVIEIQDRTGNEWRRETRLQMLTLLRLFVFHDRCAPHLRSSGLILALNARLRGADDLGNCSRDFWVLSAQVLIRAHEYHVENGGFVVGMGLKPTQIGHLVVLGVTLYASGLDRECEEVHAGCLERLFKLYPQHNQPGSFYAHIADDDLDPFRFYHILQALRTLSYKSQDRPGFDWSVKFITGLWLEWGSDAGITEEAARSAYEKGRARFCGWKQCCYHVDPADRPLSLCKGCGKVSYCGAECQLKDWKEGEHKKHCRRLKEAA